MTDKDLTKMGLTNKEFYKQSCRWADVTSIQTAAKWWSAFAEVIIRELYYNGTCRLPLLGTFSTRTVGEALQKQIGPEGKPVIYRVPERQVPIFTPADDFINDINCQGVTKAYRKRLKSGTLTQRDWERQIRAESMNVSGTLSEERIEASKEKFKLLLKEKKTKCKGKVENEDGET